jgi:regulatory protein
MTATPSAYLAGLRLLARRELTSAQLRERLLARGHPADEAEIAMARLRESGALDDGRAARAYASVAVRVKGRGRFRVLRELEATGVDEATAREALDAALAETDEAALLDKAIDRRLRGPITDETHLRRLHRYLVRLGFHPAEALDALRKRRRRA